MRPPTRIEKRVFGDDVQLHVVTEMPLENGVGALAPDQQALLQHVPIIAEQQGQAAANEMHKKIIDYMKFEAAEATLTAAKTQVARDGIKV
jgi:hypothetical protein